MSNVSKRNPSPLDKKLKAQKKTEEPTDPLVNWDLDAMKAVLTEDSSMLRESLAITNQRLADTGSPPLVNMDNVSARKDREPKSETIDDTSAVSAAWSEIRMGAELEQRLNGMEDLVGPERLKVIRDLILKDRGADRLRFDKAEKSLLARIEDEQSSRRSMEEANTQAENKIDILKSQLHDLNDKIEKVESAWQAKLSRREAEMRVMRDELAQLQSRLLSEESEKIKAIERLRKREVDNLRQKELMDKLNVEMVKAQEERDSMANQLSGLSEKISQLSQLNQTTSEDLRKKDAELRVLKRNAHRTMPEEFRRLADRLRGIEVEKKRLSFRVEELEKQASEGRGSVRAKEVEILQLRTELASATKKVDDLSKQATYNHQEAVEERKMRMMESQRLHDKTFKFTQKLLGEEELRMQIKTEGKVVAHEAHHLRRRNMDLMAQVMQLEEAKLAAEKTARDVMRRCRELEEKLDLHNTVQSSELARISFAVDSMTEDDVDYIFNARSTKTSRFNSRASSPLARASRPQSRKERLPSAISTSLRHEDDKSSMLMSPTNEADAESLRSRCMVLTQKLESEENARVAAQEKVVELAALLLEKDRETSMEGFRKRTSTSQPSSRATTAYRSGRMRDLETQNMQLLTKLHDLEMERDQLSLKMKEREEESKTMKKRVTELTFKLQLEEDAKLKLQELYEDKVSSPLLSVRR